MATLMATITALKLALSLMPLTRMMVMARAMMIAGRSTMAWVEKKAPPTPRARNRPRTAARRKSAA